MHGQPLESIGGESGTVKWWDRGTGRRLTVLAALLLAGGFAGWWTFVRMPGTTFTGSLPPLDPEAEALAVELRRDVTALSRDIGVRNSLRPSALARASSWVEHELAAAGLSPSREAYTLDGHSFANVIAQVGGTSAAGEIVVIGAHYDSAIGSPGGNDNGSGTAALLALARRIAARPLPRTVRFVAFTNEEPPFFQTAAMGSLVNATAARTRGDRITAMISLETLGFYSDAEGSQTYPMGWLRLAYPERGNFIAFVGESRDRELVRRAIRAFRSSTPFPSEGAALPAFVPGVGWSDHWAFDRAGYPAFMVTDTATFRDRTYHTAGDDHEHLDYERMARVVSGILRVVADLADPHR
jgi:hypothetical protein